MEAGTVVAVVAFLYDTQPSEQVDEDSVALFPADCDGITTTCTYCMYLYSMKATTPSTNIS